MSFSIVTPLNRVVPSATEADDPPAQVQSSRQKVKLLAQRLVGKVDAEQLEGVIQIVKRGNLYPTTPDIIECERLLCEVKDFQILQSTPGSRSI